MSVINASERQETECKQCSVPYKHGYNGAYCSADCLYRSKGEGILSDLEDDHKVCSTCFSTLKEIEEPPERATDAAIGIEHPTVKATRADGAPHPADVDDLGVLRPTPSTHTPLACECGTIDNARDETLERVEGAAVLLNLWGQLCRLFTQGAIDDAPSKKRLLDGLRERGERDWAFAIGYALHGSEQ